MLSINLPGGFCLAATVCCIHPPLVENSCDRPVSDIVSTSTFFAHACLTENTIPCSCTSGATVLPLAANVVCRHDPNDTHLQHRKVLQNLIEAVAFFVRNRIRGCDAGAELGVLDASLGESVCCCTFEWNGRVRHHTQLQRSCTIHGDTFTISRFLPMRLSCLMESGTVRLNLRE